MVVRVRDWGTVQGEVIPKCSSVSPFPYIELGYGFLATGWLASSNDWHQAFGY